MQNTEPSSVGKAFVMVLILSSAISFSAFYFLSFEIAVLVTICLGISFLTAAMVGIENIIISSKSSK